jgi:hypothetical protein
MENIKMDIQDKNSKDYCNKNKEGSEMCPEKAAAKGQNGGTESKNQICG